jgi:hypothetical protein
MSKNITFRPIPNSAWGFQPLEPLSEAWGVNEQGKACRLGVLHKTYRNEPGHTPGKPIWVYAIDGKGSKGQQNQQGHSGTGATGNT